MAEGFRRWLGPEERGQHLLDEAQEPLLVKGMSWAYAEKKSGAWCDLRGREISAE